MEIRNRIKALEYIHTRDLLALPVRLFDRRIAALNGQMELREGERVE